MSRTVRWGAEPAIDIPCYPCPHDARQCRVGRHMFSDDSWSSIDPETEKCNSTCFSRLRKAKLAPKTYSALPKKHRRNCTCPNTEEWIQRPRSNEVELNRLPQTRHRSHMQRRHAWTRKPQAESATRASGFRWFKPRCFDAGGPGEADDRGENRVTQQLPKSCLPCAPESFPQRSKLDAKLSEVAQHASKGSLPN